MPGGSWPSPTRMWKANLSSRTTCPGIRDSIMEIVNGGELHPPKLMYYMLSDGAKQPACASCKMWGMMSAVCEPSAAA